MSVIETGWPPVALSRKDSVKELTALGRLLGRRLYLIASLCGEDPDLLVMIVARYLLHGHTVLAKQFGKCMKKKIANTLKETESLFLGVDLQQAEEVSNWTRLCSRFTRRIFRIMSKFVANNLPLLRRSSLSLDELEIYADISPEEKASKIVLYAIGAEHMRYEDVDYQVGLRALGKIRKKRSEARRSRYYPRRRRQAMKFIAYIFLAKAYTTLQFEPRLSIFSFTTALLEAVVDREENHR